MATFYPLSPIPSHFSLDPDAAFVPAHFRLPVLAHIRTFGHSYRATRSDQPGGRFRYYQKLGTDYAVPSGLAVDVPTGVTFYTQAPPPGADEITEPVRDFHEAPSSTYRQEADPKLPRSKSSVWIVMVY